MNIKIIAVIVLVVGIALLLLSLLADVVGIGGEPRVFGYKQIAGGVAGAIIAIVGAVLYWRASRRA